jgi:hypothetical protein
MAEITGYRKLSDHEIELINAIKRCAIEVGFLVDQVKNDPDTDKRSAAIGATELQTGFMWLSRAVAKPETF